MKGMDLAEAYFNQYGQKMIDEELAQYRGYLAAGLAGEGSECFGYDDHFDSRRGTWNDFVLGSALYHGGGGDLFLRILDDSQVHFEKSREADKTRLFEKNPGDDACFGTCAFGDSADFVLGGNAWNGYDPADSFPGGYALYAWQAYGDRSHLAYCGRRIV